MMYRTCSRCRTVFLSLVVSCLLIAGGVLAAPHEGDRFSLGQPDGTTVEVRVWGDEFYQRVESLDGYTLVRDDATGVICYARLSAAGDRFESTGIAADQPAPAGLVRGLRLTTEARSAAAWKVRNEFLAEERALLANKDRDPQPSSLGNVLGLTIIIDFSDEPGTVPAADFHDYLNLPGYNGYNNNGSVRDYFHDVSGGALTYNNWVPDAYLRAPQPKTYYEDPSIQYGQRARQLVSWALNALDAQGHDFSQYDANGDGFIDAINVFYAGSPTGGWSVGLWPHSSVINFFADGVSSYRYQITNIGSSLRLSTFCHENGHMIMFWPDLYDYGHESSGVGGFCLMCSSGPGTNPVRPCAYLRAVAGWVEPVLLEGLQGGLEVSHDAMNVFKVPYEGHPNEYYLMENRIQSGRDYAIPDEGMAIWHVDEFGSNNNEQQTPSLHYLVTLVQADGLWDLEQGNNNGDIDDLWGAPRYTEFTPTTIPPALWWDGREAPLYIDGVSVPGEIITFNYREALGTMAVNVDPQPAELAAPWTLTGPNDYELTGEGFRSVLVWDEGDYTLTWGDVPGWTEPDPLSVTVAVAENGEPAVITGYYTNPPFVLAEAGAAGDTGPAAAVALVDVDGDGDDDLHVVNAGAADVLLRNDGGLVFTDITPAELADTGAGRAAAWSDFDDDGDRDLYLVRDGEANRLFEQEDGAFNDVTALNYGIDDAGSGQDASWCDVDGDGYLDLYLVVDGGNNILFKNYGPASGDHHLLIGSASGVLGQGGPGRAALWCDYDLDGDRDVYLVNDMAANMLVRSYAGTMFEDAGAIALANIGSGADAVWGDFDNDGKWDLYLVNDGQPDAFFYYTGSYFQQVIEPVVSDNGPGRSVAAADFDNDGYLDLYVARYGAEDMLLFGNGAGDFVRTPVALAETMGNCVAAVCSDLDGDGGVDIYIGRAGAANVILHNQIAERGHWVALDLRGDESGRDAVGARVRVVAGGRSFLRQVQGGDGQGQASRLLHIGLGTATSVDSVLVTWPGGAQTVATDLTVDQRLVIFEDPNPTAVDDPVLPAATSLRGAYPNPFNPATTIAFDLARPGPVELAIYGLDGRRVAVLVSDDLPAGTHEAAWQGRDGTGRPVASGTYLYRLKTVDGPFSGRLTLVK